MTILLIISILSLLVSVWALRMCQRSNAFTRTPYLLPLGAFVWGDALILGPFWSVSALIAYLRHDILLFGLITSLFWVIRGLGEMVYWIAQQFSTLNRNPPASLDGYRFVRNESIWFLYQVFWQCVIVVSIVASLILGKNWLASL